MYNNYYNNYEDEEPLLDTYDEGRDYTSRERERLADEWLRRDSRAETCRECRGYGEPTGSIETREQAPKDRQGNRLSIDFPEYECKNGHRWFAGEGKARGIDGDNPILFEEHFQQRRRREIYTSQGVPDPSIVTGLYNRSHPLGRKINSDEQRKRNGASYYRAVDPTVIAFIAGVLSWL